MMIRFLIFLTGSLFFMIKGAASVPYKVEYIGVDNAVVLKTIKATSHLSTLRKNSPDSINALRYRAEADIPDILKILRAHGYYEATVQVRIQEAHPQTIALVYIHTGPVYKIKSFSVSAYQGATDHPVSCTPLSSTILGIRIGSAIHSQDVINAELLALANLSVCGYPLATVTHRSIVADGDTKTVDIHIEIDTGELSFFGPLEIKGNSQVRDLYVEQKLEWKQGSTYSSDLVEETQKALMDSGLFSSVAITHGEIPSPTGELPMYIEVSENKHRSIYGGVSYQTYYGPGVTAGWEHRNIARMGQQLSLRWDQTKRSHSGMATYLIPNFCRIGQDYVWEGNASYLNIFPFSDRSYSLTNRFEKRFDKKARIAFGVKAERLLVHSSVLNGNYWLVEVPIFFAYNASNNLLNPTKGFNIEVKGTPTVSVSSHKKAYVTNQFALSHYLPCLSAHVVFAQKLSGAFFFSGDVDTIPVPKRFFGGSEEDLRGYTYYSVSPLTSSNKPIGGRSALYYTFETRFRLSRNIGLVPFLDTGNVTNSKVLSIAGKWRKSVGFGIRYFSFVGPFRLDMGFPLNPRKGIDKKYRVLVSIGQSF